MSSTAPLGDLPGMTWDLTRQRYFPTPKQPKATAPPVRPDTKPRTLRMERDSQASGSDPGGSAKRRRIAGVPVRTYRRREIGGYGMQDRGSLSVAEHLAGMDFEGSDGTCTCHSERITTLQNFTGGAYAAASAGGKILMQDHDGMTQQIGVCGEPLAGLHFDIARRTVLAIAGGDAPHIHYFRQNADNADAWDVRDLDLDSLDNMDISCLASYDDVVVLGSTRTLTTVMDYALPTVSSRKLPSDPLSLAFSDNPYLLYAGMRNSSVLLADLRTPTVSPSSICRVPGGKAVVGVKKVGDGAVPYGLVVSAMGNELLIYDTRFGKSPLHTLPDHINTYHASLGLALTPDSRFLFASGSDRRIGLWSTVTGERIHPTASTAGEPLKASPNPLIRIFPSMVQKLSVRDDYGLDLACAGEVLHYGKPLVRTGSEVEEDLEGRDEREENSDLDM